MPTGAAVPLVVIQGGDEKAKGEVQIKDLRLGAELAKGIESREEYKEARLAQVSVPEADLVAAVKEALAHGCERPSPGESRDRAISSRSPSDGPHLPLG